jgi:competence protein ComEC
VVPGLLTFGGLSVGGPVVNLIVVPLFGFVVVPLALAGLLALAVADGLAGVLLRPAAASIEAVLDVLARIAELPGIWLEPGTAPLWTIIAAGVAAVGLLLPLPGTARAALVLVIAPALCWRPEPLPSGAYLVTVLDVGQGLATVVRTRSRTLLFDAGPAWRGGGDAGASVVVPFLAAAGVRQVDALVLSHGDLDHRGGADSVERRYRPARRWVGPDAAREGSEGAACTDGGGWRWDGIEFRFLHPPAGEGLAGNDSSCVLLVAGPGGRTLLTGDIEAAAETVLLEARRIGVADLVVAPHHGSDTSSTPQFVAATKARWVVFPAGRDNRWGFPAPAVQARWAGSGARHWTTGLDGAVEFAFPSGATTRDPRGWRCEQPRFWRYRRCRRGTRVPGPNDSQYHAADPAPRSEGPDG